jgi:exonuclease SbcC
MIERILYRNFQAHDSTDITLDPGVTVIVGRTDKGKSSLIRGLAFLAFNRPAGSSLIKRGTSTASVQAKIDGKVLARVRGKKKNLYKLDGKSYNAFSTKVPIPIEQFLALDEDNFQFQIDSPYLLTESAGAAAKKLNSIVNLESIDAISSSALAEVRRAKTAVDIKTKEVERAETTVQDLSWVPDFYAKKKAVEEATTRMTAAKEKAVLLRERLATLSGKVQAFQNKRTVFLQLKEAVEAGRAAAELQSKADKLRLSLDKISSLKAKLLFPDFAPVVEARSKGDQISERRGKLQIILKAIQEKRDRLCRLKSQAGRIAKEMEKLLEGGCPLCGSQVAASRLLPQTCTSAIRHLEAEENPKESGFP